MGSFLSLDLFLFFVFFEIVLVPMYFLIGGWGYEGREYAATKFFLYTMAGSAFMLVSILATVFIARDNGVGKICFDLIELAEGANFAASTGRWLFFGFAIAFAVKVPIFPLHTWRPTHTPRPQLLALSCLRVRCWNWAHTACCVSVSTFSPRRHIERSLWLTLAVIGIIYGAIAATMQKDLKRLVAYSSVAHLVSSCSAPLHSPPKLSPAR